MTTMVKEPEYMMSSDVTSAWQEPIIGRADAHRPTQPAVRFETSQFQWRENKYQNLCQ